MFYLGLSDSFEYMCYVSTADRVKGTPWDETFSTSILKI